MRHLFSTKHGIINTDARVAQLVTLPRVKDTGQTVDVIQHANAVTVLRSGARTIVKNEVAKVAAHINEMGA